MLHTRAAALIVTLSIFAAVGLLGPATALSQPPGVEPDNDITRAGGPLAGGTDYAGNLETDDDSDWYVFYVSSQRQFTVSVTAVAHNSDRCVLDETRAALSDGDGYGVDERRIRDGETETWATTSPVGGPTRYYLRVSACSAGASYKVRVDPADAVVPAAQAPPEQGFAEPNDFASQATGPLAGGVLYRGAIETVNDVDVFSFYTAAGGRQLDVSITQTAGSCSGDLSVALYREGQGSLMQEFDVFRNQWSHARFSAPQAGRYFVTVARCYSSQYALRVDPASALVGTPVPPSQSSPTAPNSVCSSARKRLRRYSAAAKKARKKLSKTESRKRRRKLKRQLGNAQKGVRRGRAQVNAYC